MTPPNGITAWLITPVFVPTIPTSSASATRHTRPTSREKKYPASPTDVAFASRSTSSSVSNFVSAASGPNVSSEFTSASAGTSASTVGAKNEPAPGRRLPPCTSCAPFASASSTCFSTFSTARSWISGPCVLIGEH